jgi:hypothetical protein
MDVENGANEPAASRGRAPLIFISHDTRDAEVAEAFSRLLSSVSAGVLKSFRSSDKKGNQGIEYGVEWFPEIMKKLETASDVVCLLTPHSVGRPWILYEAGVAKGKLDTPVHGLAIGIPLQNASTGPFAQFQNSDDSEDALTQLVMQLVRRIPGSEPDREVVKGQVAAFRGKVLPMLAAGQGEEKEPETDSTSVAKLFEEVKVMFQDLPTRIERRLDPDYPPNVRRRRRALPHAMFEMVHIMGRDMPEGMQLVILASQFRDDFPWLYEMAFEAYRKISAKESGAMEALSVFEKMLHVTMEHPLFRELMYRSKDRAFEFEETMSMLRDFITRFRSRGHSRVDGDVRQVGEVDEAV